MEIYAVHQEGTDAPKLHKIPVRYVTNWRLYFEEPVPALGGRAKLDYDEAHHTPVAAWLAFADDEARKRLAATEALSLAQSNVGVAMAALELLENPDVELPPASDVLDVDTMPPPTPPWPGTGRLPHPLDYNTDD